jgi:hypothetical protein
MIRAVDKIKITFKQRGNNPYYIKKLEVMGFSCPEYERINLNSLKANKRKYKAPFNNETALGYIANLNPIDSDLNARETPPWLDFLVKYTYPKLTLYLAVLLIITAGQKGFVIFSSIRLFQPLKQLNINGTRMHVRF